MISNVMSYPRVMSVRFIGVINADAVLSLDRLPDLEQDIQDVLEMQTFSFPKLIAVTEKEPRSGCISANEERIWRTFIPYASGEL